MVLRFRDVPQAIDQADSADEIQAVGEKALGSCLEFYMKDKQPFPLASAPKKGEIVVELPLWLSAKVALFNTMLKNRYRQVDLVEKLGIPSSEAARIVNPWKKVKIDTMVKAIKAVGGNAFLGFQL